MIFFPLVNAPNCKGWNSINFFPPNNWENEFKGTLYLYLLTIEDNVWVSHLIEKSNEYKSLIVHEKDVGKISKSNQIKVFCLSYSVLPKTSTELFNINFNSTSLPTWRSSIGISNQTNSSSYQGEIIAFKPGSSFLTFAPFLQFAPDIDNYFLFVNLEKNTKLRESEIFFSSLKHPNNIKSHVLVKNNFVNVIKLDNLDYSKSSLPLISCKDMAGLPLFVSINKITNAISIEHTHPGASFVVHGKRWVAQNLLKEKWFKKIFSN